MQRWIALASIGELQGGAMQPFSAFPASDRVEATPLPRWAASAPHVADRERSAGDAESRRMAAVELAYRRHGGLASADEVVNMLGRRNHAQPLSRVARWLVAGDVVSFERQSRTWLPLFQFELRAMALRPEVRVVIRELSGVFDGWELASWFVSPNNWLGNMTPVAALTTLPAVVREAARVDRFIACG
jgi:hypothetical protein